LDVKGLNMSNITCFFVTRSDDHLGLFCGTGF
jgi:hypothetical protein